MVNKHAYLIMAHNDFYILERLLLLLDDERNDFYIHIDKKVKDFDFNYFKNLLTKSSVHYIDRIDVRWGDFSQVQTELLLLKKAVVKEYSYYHLISGVDMPLKSNKYIHDFFTKHDGKEFIHFCDRKQTENMRKRVSRYYFMRMRHSPYCINRVWGMILNKSSEILSNIFHLYREWDNTLSLAYGSQWFSITHKCATYILSCESWIYKYFRYSNCSDELYLQTIIYNSEFKNHLYWPKSDGNYEANLRLIDWERGKPYVWRKKDYNELINSDRIFARKFSSTIDNEIIDKIFEKLYLNNKYK